MRGDLDARLLAAHAAGEARYLVDLYSEAADASTDENAVGFYLTHALVFALETAHGSSGALRHRLVCMGRENEE